MGANSRIVIPKGPEFLRYVTGSTSTIEQMSDIQNQNEDNLCKTAESSNKFIAAKNTLRSRISLPRLLFSKNCLTLCSY